MAQVQAISGETNLVPAVSRKMMGLGLSVLTFGVYGPTASFAQASLDKGIDNLKMTALPDNEWELTMTTKSELYPNFYSEEVMISTCRQADISTKTCLQSRED